jgi:hypothetical protein
MSDSMPARWGRRAIPLVFFRSIIVSLDARVL